MVRTLPIENKAAEMDPSEKLNPSVSMFRLFTCAVVSNGTMVAEIRSVQRSILR